MKGTKIKIRCERFMMNMPEKDIEKVESLARQNGVTMSWLYRALLFALEKEFSSGLPEEVEIHRPDKFDEDFRKITVCMYGDKSKWITLSRIWNVELGPLIRFALELYFKGLLVLDLESVQTVKQTKNHGNGRMKIISEKLNRFEDIRCVCQYQNEAELYSGEKYRPKNPDRNIFLMEMGLNNRKRL